MDRKPTQASCFEQIAQQMAALRALLTLAIILCAVSASAYMFDSPVDIVLTAVTTALQAGISRLRSIPAPGLTQRYSMSAAHRS
jgi:hypothetical protein